MEIITNPWHNKFIDLVADSKESIKITSPFINKNICNDVISHKNKDAKFELITNFKIRNIYTGSVDLDGLEHIIENRGLVKNHSLLHAKIYLFDDKNAIITSANLTKGGLYSNYEYGLFTDDTEIVSKIAHDFNSLSNHDDTGIILKRHIYEVRTLLTKMPEEIVTSFPKYDLTDSDKLRLNEDDVVEIKNEVLTSTLRGWKLEVFKCVNSISNSVFSIHDVYKFENHLQNLYPKNRHITDKIRQQLQSLRDTGLIEFKGNGLYRKLWKTND